ncbi:hypothetical protein J3D49_004463 [Pseudomonas kilonensis]|nr:hypothetical protein [Pseudomonas kilonensis]
MAQRGYLGIHAEVPTDQCLRSASVVNGAPKIKSQSKARTGACPASMWLNHRYREQARSHNGPAVNTRLMDTQNSLWERACSR